MAEETSRVLVHGSGTIRRHALPYQCGTSSCSRSLLTQSLALARAHMATLPVSRRKRHGKSGMGTRLRGTEPPPFASFNVHVICAGEALNKCLFNERKPQPPGIAMGAGQRSVCRFFLFWGLLSVLPAAVAVGGTQKLAARSSLLGSGVH